MKDDDNKGRKDLARRDFLKITSAAVGAISIGATGKDKGERHNHATTITRGQKRHHKHRTPKPAITAADSLTKFVDALPIMPVIFPSGNLNGDPFFDVNMVQFTKRLHRDLPPTRLWGYNGVYPGPTFEARRGRPIAVQWRNSLPTSHFLPIDTTIHGAEPDKPPVRTVVHLHGHKVLPASDGYPEAWFTRNFAQTGPFFENRVYHYPNDQQATTLWYHDHALGVTRLNVYAGLSGMYILRDNVDDSLPLPSGEFEIPLIIQDRFFNPDGSLLYPTQTPGDPDPRVPPIWIPEFFGDTVLVNGKIWPFLEVEPRKYRFRILNSSNARFYNLTLNESDSRGNPNGHAGPLFIQIGSDGGFLPAPVKRNSILTSPAERFDVVIDFSDFEDKFIVMSNDARAPFPDGDDIVPPDVMLFKVGHRLSSPDRSSVPSSLNPVPLLSTSQSVRTRDLVLSELDSAPPFENPIIALINDAHWDDPITETPRAGSVELWRIINTTGDAHPIHIHLVQFQILNRQPFDTDQYPDRLVFTGPTVRPPADERPAFKDTVKSMPGEVTRLLMKFDLPTGTRVRRGDKFLYVFHCHILEHEENEMMRPYNVVG
jgi:spore coat protein A